MKIAVPTRDKQVDNHFGHCEYYTVIEVDQHKKQIGMETVPSPEGCGCKSNIATVLKEKGVDIMLAGNMGEGALNVLKGQGIRVIRGCSGDVNMLVEEYLKGNIKDSGESCKNHHDGHNAKWHVCSY